MFTVKNPLKMLTKMNSKKGLSTLAILLLAMSAGVFYSNVNEYELADVDCDFTEKSCNLLNQSIELTLEFLDKPETEEELSIKFIPPSGFEIEKAWIEGVNMYMGKTPVLFETQVNDQRLFTNKQTGITFLGSCNLKEMKWRLYVEIENNGQTLRYSAIFFTRT